MPLYEGPQQVKIAVAGKTYVFRPGEITPRISRRVRQETGMSLVKALSLMEEDPDLDVLATMCFAAALQTDPDHADLDTIDGEFMMGSEITIDFPSEEEESDPEA